MASFNCTLKRLLSSYLYGADHVEGDVVILYTPYCLRFLSFSSHPSHNIQSKIRQTVHFNYYLVTLGKM